jgi:hypothetical protein
MTVELRSIENAGDLERERVVLRATKDDDIGRFALFRCHTTTKGKVASGSIPAAYWFPDQKIKKGDFVVLYSKSGVNSEKKGDNGGTSYFYYWGLKSPQWPKYIAALVETGSNWTRSEPVK